MNVAGVYESCVASAPAVAWTRWISSDVYAHIDSTQKSARIMGSFRVGVSAGEKASGIAGGSGYGLGFFARSAAAFFMRTSRAIMHMRASSNAGICHCLIAWMTARHA